MMHPILQKIAEAAFEDELHKLGVAMMPTMANTTTSPTNLNSPSPPKQAETSSQFKKTDLQGQNQQKLTGTKWFRSVSERRADINSSNRALSIKNDTRIHRQKFHGKTPGQQNARMAV